MFRCFSNFSLNAAEVPGSLLLGYCNAAHEKNVFVVALKILTGCHSQIALRCLKALKKEGLMYTSEEMQ